MSHAALFLHNSYSINVLVLVPASVAHPTAFYYDIQRLQRNDAKCMYFNNISWLKKSHFVWSKVLHRLAYNPIFDYNLIHDFAYA